MARMSPASRTLAVVEATRFRGHDPEYHAYVQVLVGGVVRAAEADGWTVRRLAADGGTEALLAATDRTDAVVIVGGEDISPRFYGGSGGYPHESLHRETADAAQLALVHSAIERGLPLLGICRGLQIVNVALGGTLVQDLGESDHVRRGVPIVAVQWHPEDPAAPAGQLAALFGALRTRAAAAVAAA